MARELHIGVRALAVGYDGEAVQRDLDFDIGRGSVFVIMGGSGCGKSTLLRSLMGLTPPLAGQVLVQAQSFWEVPVPEQDRLRQGMGVMYQNGALWSSMTLAENVSLALEEHTDLDADTVRELATLKLALVGLRGFEDHYPAEISGGMRKRVGVARAMALDPDVLFFDEPSAGLDPVSSRLLDELILALRDSLGCTMVVVTHELDSIFTIADDSLFLDADAHTAIAGGDPRELRDHGVDERVLRFLQRRAR